MDSSRRNFIRSAAVGSGALVAGCTHIDRYVLGDEQDESSRVVILGAGLAGLMAARELKKQGIPFRVFEASERIGGRVLSIEDFNSAAQIAEMGAEWFSADDNLVRDLCKEHKLQVLEAKLESGFFWNKTWLKNSERLAGQSSAYQWIKQLRNQTSMQNLEKMHVGEFIKKIRGQVADWIPMLLNRTVQLEYGCDPEDLAVTSWLEKQPWSSIDSSRYKVSAGSSSLSRALYDRLVGVVPGRVFRLGWKLSEIYQARSGVELVFETPEGRREVQASMVICTIPFSVLRNISGVFEMDISEDKKNIIKNMSYGSHTKIAMGLSEKFWMQKNMPLIWTGDFDSQWVWESTIASGFQKTSRGILAAQMGGSAGTDGGLHTLDQLRKDLINMRLIESKHEETFQIVNWSRMAFSQGSVSYLKPGQQSLLKSIAKPELNNRLIFAGEHTSSNKQGTMQGALESGVRAAKEAAQNKSLLENRLTF